MAKYQLGSVSLSSSQDPEKLAAWVQGIIVGASSLIIFAAGHFFNLQLTSTNIVEFAGIAGTLVGSIAGLFGLIRKLVAWFTEVKNNPTA